MDLGALQHLADLAKLHLDDATAARAAEQLDRLLAAFTVLQEVDTDGVPASPYPLPIAARLRPDVAGAPLSQDEVLANAPEQSAGCFRVPRMVDG
jgi:aspartyl-tRNA(Asn)/glutamyl-tRNA(Gln) amidotransferase subunit C